MNQTTKNKLIDLIIALAIGCAMAFILIFSNCSTIPPTPGTHAIDAILTDGTLDSLPPAEKEKAIVAYKQAREDIVRAEAARIDAEDEAKKATKWAGIGKGVFGAGIAIGGILTFLIAFRIVRKFL